MRREGEEAKLITNFEAAAPSTYFAELYQKDQLYGGHVIMLGADPESKCAVSLLTSFRYECRSHAKVYFA